MNKKLLLALHLGIFSLLYSCNHTEDPTIKLAKHTADYIDSIGLDELSRYSFTQFTPNQNFSVHKVTPKTREILYGLFYLTNEQDEMIRVTKGGYLPFCADYGIEQTYDENYDFLYLSSIGDSIRVYSKDEQGSIVKFNTIHQKESKHFFTRNNPFTTAQKLHDITLASGATEWHYNANYNFWRFICNGKQLLYYPPNNDLSTISEDSHKIKDRWYLYLPKSK